MDKQQIPATLLKDRFDTNPFSILRADTGDWISQKRAWENILKDREDNIRDIIAKSNTPYINNFEKVDFKGAKSPNAGMISTFDPFLCEIMIKWFSKTGDTILDPFAGGVVRGAVSCILGRQYIGYDISPKQVEHNQIRWSKIKASYTGGIDNDPLYKVGDSEYLLDTVGDETFDMMLACPPYYNLEQYTDNEQDLSNLKTYDEFIIKYSNILNKCYNKIKCGGFCVLVVEEIRDKKGVMYGFVADTIKSCQKAGFDYYNEMILMNPIASLGIRSTKYFVDSRKVGRHHQNVLVFKK